MKETKTEIAQTDEVHSPRFLAPCLISDIRLEVDEICALLGHEVACSGTSLPTFRDNVSVLSSKPLKMVPIRQQGITIYAV